MSDRLHDTLSTLRTDVDSMPLADSSAVRARGAQRTRRQAVGTSLAVVALVAGAVGISGALTFQVLTGLALYYLLRPGPVLK